MRSPAARIAAHTQILSSDLFEGRAPATRGGDLATAYLATQLALAGLEPAATTAPTSSRCRSWKPTVDRGFSLTRARARLQATATDVVAFSGLEDAQVTVRGEVVFVGHGIVAPEQKWNDYAGVDVKGKWVLDHGERPAGAGRRTDAVRRRGAHLLRPLDLQVRRGGPPGRGGRPADSHRRVRDLSLAGRAVVVDGHAVFAAAGGRGAVARREGVDHQ